MAIEFKCVGCGNLLRVPDKHAGKNAKCPGCATLNTIPNTIPDGADNFQAGNNPFDNSQAQPSVPEKTPVPNPFTGSGPYPYQPQNAYQGVPGYSHLPPHRGGAVLALGLISTIGNILLCCIFPMLGIVMSVPGIFAWVMGTKDLKKMSLGSMDPSGRSLTQVGLVFGIVGVILGVLQIVLGVVFLVVALSAQAAGV